jgi:ADP-heptose:LPS heptosyltransferase
MTFPSQHSGAEAARQRRAGGLWLVRLLQPFLQAGLGLAKALTALQRQFGGLAEPKRGVTVFQSYMVGDLFMALPALQRLRERLPTDFPLQVVCRPDCAELLRSEGFHPIALGHPWFLRNALGTFLQSTVRAWRLRDQATTWALDTDADPRSAWLLRLMGHGQVVSYARPGGVLFHRTFELAIQGPHQSEKNVAVIDGFCRLVLGPAHANRNELPSESPKNPRKESPASTPPDRAWTPSEAWAALESEAFSVRSPQQSTSPEKTEVALSVWVMATTRKDTKNWPLAQWDALLTRLYASGVRFSLVDVPDGDASWRAFVKQWSERVPIIRLALPDLWRALQEQTHVITLDNFLGHMAAFAGKQVLWINGSSDADHVRPVHWRGENMDASLTRVVQVDPMPCRPCGHRCTESRHAHCLTDLSVEKVWTELKAWDIWPK